MVNIRPWRPTRDWEYSPGPSEVNRTITQAIAITGSARRSPTAPATMSNARLARSYRGATGLQVTWVSAGAGASATAAGGVRLSMSISALPFRGSSLVYNVNEAINSDQYVQARTGQFPARQTLCQELAVHSISLRPGIGATARYGRRR